MDNLIKNSILFLSCSKNQVLSILKEILQKIDVKKYNFALESVSQKKLDKNLRIVLHA